MKDIGRLVEEVITRIDPEGKITKEQFDALLAGTLPRISKLFLGSLLKRSPSMLRQRRKGLSGFKSRHLRRWGKPFDLIETFLVIAHEAGEQFNAEYRDEATRNKDHKFVAIISLHVRALLVANEIVILLQNGFPDGALGRWRSLHEIAVVACFLAQHEAIIAERYLSAFSVHSYRAMLQYKEHQEVAGLMPFGEMEADGIENLYRETIDKYGPEMDSDYGWASPVFGKSKPNFFDLEKNVGLSHWRPHYKWASQYNHGNFKPHPTLLAMVGSGENLLLAGPSNRGLTDPAQMMSVSLYLATKALLGLRPTIDHYVISDVLDKLADQVAKAFWSSEQRLTRWDAQKRSQ